MPRLSSIPTAAIRSIWNAHKIHKYTIHTYRSQVLNYQNGFSQRHHRIPKHIARSFHGARAPLFYSLDAFTCYIGRYLNSMFAKLPAEKRSLAWILWPNPWIAAIVGHFRLLKKIPSLLLFALEFIHAQLVVFKRSGKYAKNLVWIKEFGIPASEQCWRDLVIARRNLYEVEKRPRIPTKNKRYNRFWDGLQDNAKSLNNTSGRRRKIAKKD